MGVKLGLRTAGVRSTGWEHAEERCTEREEVTGDPVYNNVVRSCIISTYFYLCYPIKIIELVGM